MINILFIHGILGKPDYFDFLRPSIPADCCATSILLEGHGGTPRDFARASMAQWRVQTKEAVDRLSRGNDKLLIVAHSMGTLFAIESAARGKADGLFLLNPPLSLRLTRRLIATPFKVVTGRINDPLTRAAKEAYSITDDKNLLHYLGWIPRYLELFAEIRRVRAIAGEISVATRAYFSAHDEMVSAGSAQLFPDSPEVALTLLPDSGHYFYADRDRAVIIADFARFLQRFEAE